MKKPKVSVILPVYNGKRFIRQAVKSVFDQTFDNFELIVIDDGSTDKTFQTLSVFKDKRIRIIRNDQNLGVAKSLNIGMNVARGEYIARCDGDDINLKNRFKTQVKFLDNHQDYALVGSNVRLIDEKGKAIGMQKYPQTDQKIRKEIFIKNPVSHPSVMLRRNIIKKIGGYREFFNGAEDYDLWFRLLHLGKLYNLSGYLVKRRIHSQVVTKKDHFKVEILAIILRIIHLFNNYF